MNDFSSLDSRQTAIIRLPEDVIFYVIVPMICDIKQCCRWGGIQEDESKSEINMTRAFSCVSKFGRDAIKLQSEKCWRIGGIENTCRLTSGSHIWCRFHYPMEFTLGQGVLIKIKNKRVWGFDPPVDGKCIEPGVVADQAYHLSEGWMNDSGKLEIIREDLVEGFLRLFRGSSFGISHRCCGGTGIMYGTKR